MAGEYTVGPVLSVTLDGNVFQCANDGSFTGLRPAFTKTVVAGTRRNFVNYQRQETSAECQLQVTWDEAEVLKALTTRTDSFPISFEHANGTVYTCTGKISYDNIDNNGRTSGFKMIPDEDWTKLS
ncbi:MAG: hypothetical protein LBD20_02620 [Spirochaetaceae bacterium]|jgi:hypothetical protein|nr:hypothetical protein [Spirochaetaceae bacterium]